MQENTSYAEEYIKLRKKKKELDEHEALAANEDINEGYLLVSYTKMEFEKREVIPSKLWMVIPKEFDIMDERIVRNKYPNVNRPEYIYTNADTTINLTYSIDQGLVTDGEIIEVRNLIAQQMQRLHPSSLMEKEDILVGDKTISSLSFTVPVIDGDLFNMMYFMEINNNLLLGCFSCNKFDKKEWKPIFVKMLETVEIRENPVIEQ